MHLTGHQRISSPSCKEASHIRRRQEGPKAPVRALSLRIFSLLPEGKVFHQRKAGQPHLKQPAGNHKGRKVRLLAALVVEDPPKDEVEGSAHYLDHKYRPAQPDLDLI